METLVYEEAVSGALADFDKDEVLAIYLTGSRLNNLHTEDSDVDLYVILKQNKRNLVLGNLKSKEKVGDKNYKAMELAKFFQLLYKTNPNLLEIIFKRPLYASDEYKELGDFIYDNRVEIVSMNTSRYFSSAYHMAKNNYNKVKNGTGKVAQGRAGKELVNFYKAYFQADTFHSNRENLEEAIIFKGAKRQKLLDIKSINELTPEKRVEELDTMENCLDILDYMNKVHKDKKPDFSIFDELIKYV